MGIRNNNTIKIIRGNVPSTLGSLGTDVSQDEGESEFLVDLTREINRGRNIRDMVKPGDRIILLADMIDDYSPTIPMGTRGTVALIDSSDTIHTDWDNGRSLGVVLEVDHVGVVLNSKKDRKRIAALRKK